MGFLDHTTNNIIVDAVLTDKGREKLARAEGLSIIKYAFADTEVDYTILQKYGEIVGKEKIEKNTPIFEANTANHIQTRHSLLTDGSGGTVSSITVAQTQSTGPSYSFSATFTGFDANQDLTLRIYYTGTKWTLDGYSPVLAGDASGLVSVAVLQKQCDANGSLVLTLPFKTKTTTPGDHIASFEIVEDSGVSSASSAENTQIQLTVQ